MKKIVNLAVFSLIFGVFLMGCVSSEPHIPQPGEVTKFEGKWLVNETHLANIKATDYSFTFKGNEFIYRRIWADPQYIGLLLEGTFYYTNNKITFIVPDRQDRYQEWSAPYVLQGNKLSLDPSGEYPGGTFYKQ